MATGDPIVFNPPPWAPRPGDRVSDIVTQLERRISELEKRVLILEPSEEVLNKHPALAQAYQEYKIIERLTLGNEK